MVVLGSASSAATVATIVEVAELDDVQDGNRAPTGCEAAAFFVPFEPARQDGAALAHDDHGRFRHLEYRSVGQVNPERLEGLVLQSIQEILGSHR
jgi:hypothetical protein